MSQIDQQLKTQITRRTVVRTGAKLAYAAPLVAASFKLDNGVGAQAAPSAACVPGTCDLVSICGSHCGCRTNASGSTSCLQNIACVDANPCTDGCSAGEVCLADTCCGDGVPRCVPGCAGVAFHFLTQGAAAAGPTGPGPWVLGNI